MAGQSVNSSFALNSSTTTLTQNVASYVKITPSALGVTSLADALAAGSEVASVENRDGYFVDPTTGTSSALTEYQEELTLAGNNSYNPGVLPHNMHEDSPGP